MSPGSQGKRAAGFAACLSLLRVPRAPPQQRSSQLSPLRSRAETPSTSTLFPQGLPAREGSCLLEPSHGNLCLGRQDLFRKARRQNRTRLGVRGLVRAVPPPRSGPSTLGAAGSVVIPECARWWHIHQGSPVPARRHPRSQLLPQPSPSATAQEARDWG